MDGLDLRGIDARASTRADDALAFSGRTAAAHSAWWEAAEGGLLLHADVTGDAKADLEVMPSGLASLGAGDLLL